MSPVTEYTSRKGEVPCGDADLYAFLTDMRNLRTVVPEGLLTEWEATEDHCSFRIEKAGRFTASLSEALPHSMIAYKADSFMTGKMNIRITVEYITGMRSAFYITAGVNMNPLLKMIIGDTAGKYLDTLIDAIESYEEYHKVRGCNQSP